MNQSVVIGYGSIGERHARVLRSLGHEVAVVSRRTLDHGLRRFASVAEAVAAARPALAVVADETARHGETLHALADAGFDGTALIEKPLTHRVLDAPPRAALPYAPYLAYNLRFHPLLRRLKAALDGATAVSAELHVGQDLRTWRPGRDLASSYSASATRGGGVLRDLSHELDYALWLFGPCRRVAALGGTSKSLGIASEDHVLLLMECARCAAVSVALNYLDRAVRRRVLINTTERTIELDFVAGTLRFDGEAPEAPVALDRDHTYREEHKALAEGRAGELCSYEEGLAVVRLIEAAERAIAERRWVEP